MASRERRGRDVRRKYNISIISIHQMLEEQDHKCAICRKEIDDRAAMDHDHKTDQLRSLLCLKCNSGLGFFDDDPDLLLQAMKYLAYWSGRYDGALDA